MGESDLVEVDTRDVRGAAGEFGVEGKAARVAAQIEDPGVLGEAREGAAILALVTEESGFMALGKIDFVTDAMLTDFYLRRGGGVGLVEEGRLDAFEGTEVVIDVNAGEFCAGEFVDEREPAEEALGDAEGIYFAEQGISIAVDHEAAKAVAVRADQAVGIGGLVEFKEVPAQRDGAANGGLEIGFVDGGGGMTDNPEGNFGSGIEETATGQITVLVIDVDEIPGARVVRNLTEETGEDGRLKCEIFELGPRFGPRRPVNGCSWCGWFGQRVGLQIRVGVAGGGGDRTR